MKRCWIWIWLLLCFQCLSTAGANDAPKGFKAQSEGECSLVVQQGIPILTLCGSPEAMGRAQGRILKDQCVTLFQRFMQPASTMSGGMASLQASAMKMEKHMPERYRKELKALARASGLAYELLVTGNAFPDVYRGGGCSTLAATGKATKGGVPLLARNLDFFTLTVLEKYSVVVVNKPDGFNAFVSITWPSLTGVLSGMNEKGLCCAVMEVRTGDRSNEGMPSMFLFRRVMEEAGSVEAGLRILEDSQKVASNNLMLMDAAGNSAVAEMGPSYFKVRKPKKEGLLYSTNHHRHKVKLLRKCWRFERFQDFTKKHYGRLDVPLLKKALDEVNQGGITVQSMVFEPVDKRLHLSMGMLPATKGSFKTLQFKDKLGQGRQPSRKGDKKRAEPVKK